MNLADVKLHKIWMPSLSLVTIVTASPLWRRATPWARLGH